MLFREAAPLGPERRLTLRDSSQDVAAGDVPETLTL